MWRKLPDFQAEKKSQNPVTSLAVMVFWSQVSFLVAPYRTILQYDRCDTPYRAKLFRELSTHPKWCDTPLWSLVSNRRICAIPPRIFGSVILPKLPTRVFVCLAKVATCLPSLPSELPTQKSREFFGCR